MKSPFVLLFISLMYVSSLSAQNKLYYLNIQPNIPQNIKAIKTEFKDSTKLNDEIRYFENKLMAAGYINFKKTQDTLIENTRTLSYHYAEVWKWGAVKFDENLLTIFPKSDILKLYKNGGKINSNLLTDAIEQVLSFAETNGYPFAEIVFDSVETKNNFVNAKVILKLNSLVKFDTLNIIDKKAIHTSFLSSYIDIKQGDVYNEKKVLSIQNRIDELGFIRLKFPPKIYFTNNVATLVLYPEKRNANKFDGLIGVQPNNTGLQTSIIGQAQLYLVNILSRGEKASVDFKSQANQTRDLKIMLNYPFIFSSSFGLTGNLDIRRQDTSFSVLGRAISVQYLLKGNNQISLVYKLSESNLLSVKKYINTNILPENLDVKKYAYGISTYFENVDYRVNPRRGYRLQSALLFGKRAISKNANINDSLYNKISLLSTQLQLMFSAQKYFNIINKQVIFLGYKTELIESENVLNNEMLRIGGINDLRGFDEESIFTSYYWVATLEYRFLLDRNSFFRLFFDQAYYFNKALAKEDYPYGIGAGVQIQTPAGMLQVSYALGAQANSGLNFQSGKIHFGIINYF